MRVRRPLLAIVAVMMSAGGLVAATAGPAGADGPGVGAPWVVSVGDSAISGEAGRWAGNTNGSSSTIDALGSTAYFDNASNTAETIHGCHRSKSAEIHIGGGVNSQNIACSGAKTSTDASGSDFKPGLDFYNGSAGQGQALVLQNFAATHNVKMVMILIGANNYHFADLIQSCVTDWLTSPSWWKNFCNDDSSVTANFTSSNVAAQTANIKGAILNIRQAMANAGYADAAYTLMVQTYWSPLPHGIGHPVLRVGLVAPEHRRLWRLERRRELGEQHGARDVQQFGAQCRRAGRADEHQDPRRAERARRPPAVREHRRPARGEGPVVVDQRGGVGQDGVGQPDPHDLDAVRSVPAPGGLPRELLGASSRCGTASARRTTAVRRAPARARPAPGSTRRASRT